MALAVDSSLYLGKTASGTSLTTAFNNVAGNALTVGVRINSTSATVTGVTYAGVAMTKTAISPVDNATAGARNYIWYLLAPATGSNNVVISTSGAVQIIAGAVSFSGADTSDFAGAENSATGTSDTPSVAVVTTRANSIVIDCVGADGDTFTGTGANQTVRWDATATRYSQGTTEPGGASGSTITMSETMSAGTANWDTQALEILEAVTPAGPANLKTWDGIATPASLKTWNGIDWADIKTWNGIS